MLSYQHIYHAGNLADVQKHALLCWMLAYMLQKDKPITYFETHAGRGLYDLDAEEALKTGEAAGGIAKADTGKWFAPDHPYMRALEQVRGQHGARAYAGSPMLAASLLRAQDKMHLCELHPQEFTALDYAMSPYAAKVYKADGLATALAVCPPVPRRGLLMIDPSYEVKTDYEELPSFIAKLHRKWNVGVIVLWYPILTSEAHRPMLCALEALELPDALRHEVRFPPIRAGHRMVGSGLFVVNAPYGAEAEMARLTALFKRKTT